MHKKTIDNNQDSDHIMWKYLSVIQANQAALEISAAIKRPTIDINVKTLVRVISKKNKAIAP